MRTVRLAFFFSFISATTLVSSFLSPLSVAGQDKPKPGTTVDAWRQSLPSDAEARTPVEETAEAVASSPSVAETKKVLLDLERRWMDSLKVGDGDSLDQILAADFAFASPRIIEGRDRTKYLEHSLRDLKLASYELDKTTVRLFGRTAIVSGRLKQKAAVNGEDWSGDYLFTDVWINREGVWRAVSRHESAIKEQK